MLNDVHILKSEPPQSILENNVKGDSDVILAHPSRIGNGDEVGKKETAVGLRQKLEGINIAEVKSGKLGAVPETAEQCGFQQMEGIECLETVNCGKEDHVTIVSGVRKRKDDFNSTDVFVEHRHPFEMKEASVNVIRSGSQAATSSNLKHEKALDIIDDELKQLFAHIESKGQFKGVEVIFLFVLET